MTPKLPVIVREVLLEDVPTSGEDLAAEKEPRGHDSDTVTSARTLLYIYRIYHNSTNHFT